jgi:Histidine kinase-like ATPase domain
MTAVSAGDNHLENAMTSLLTELTTTRRAASPPLRLVITRGTSSTLHKFDTLHAGRSEELACFTDKQALPAVGIVRAQLVRYLAGSPTPIDPEVVDDAVLCADEVLTNALVHTGSLVITVNVGVRFSEKRGTVVRVVVGDQDHHRPAARGGRKKETGICGRGLLLLSALTQWGCRRCSLGKDIWFECPRSAAPEAKDTLQSLSAH